MAIAARQFSTSPASNRFVAVMGASGGNVLNFNPKYHMTEILDKNT